ncbi:MAG: 50S ribosomal protein L11 methyltransferase [Vicinamibacterales bacterium]
MRTWPALEVGPLRQPDLFQAALLDHRVAAIDETTQPDAWRIFFSSNSDRNAAAQTLARQFPQMAIRHLDVPDEDWVAKSQACLRAVTVGTIIVAPPWDVPHIERLEPVTPGVARRLKAALYSARSPQPHVIVIRPSMGFGTGHHATTRLCLAALQHIGLQGRRVVDVGTGSGLLAIAASRLGAAHVVGMDDDLDALQAAQDNLSLNRGADVALRHADVRSVTSEPFDVVVANLTGALLRDAAPRLHNLAAPGAHVILSGFVRTEEAGVLATYSTFATTARTEEDEWLCVTLRR